VPHSARRRFSRRVWILAGCLGALAACGAPVDERARVAGVLQEDASPPPSSVVVREASEQTRRPPLATPPGEVKLTPPAPRPTEPTPRRVARTTPPVTSTPAAEPTAPEPPRPATTVDPLRLIWLGRSALADLMGTPDILHTEPPGEVWLYKSDACVAHIYLYEESGPEDYQVSYVETQNKGARVSRAECLSHLASGSASTTAAN